uniref:Uncharacterized protein n=1 Tax=Takifugu rubripes TaxID=31033 RepID=A0A674NNE1_TAKRU
DTFSSGVALAGSPHQSGCWQSASCSLHLYQCPALSLRVKCALCSRGAPEALVPLLFALSLDFIPSCVGF